MTSWTTLAFPGVSGGGGKADWVHMAVFELGGGLEMKLTVHLHAAGMGKVPAATCLPTCCRLARVPVRGPPRGPLCTSQGVLLHCAACATAISLLPAAWGDGGAIHSSHCRPSLHCCQPTQVPLGARFDAHIAPEQRFNIDAALEAAHAALVKANYLIDTGEVEVGAGPAVALLGGCPGAAMLTLCLTWPPGIRLLGSSRAGTLALCRSSLPWPSPTTPPIAAQRGGPAASG